MRELAFTRVKPAGSSRGTAAARVTPYAREATRQPRAAGKEPRRGRPDGTGQHPGEERPQGQRRADRPAAAVTEPVEQGADERGHDGERRHGEQEEQGDLAACLSGRDAEEEGAGQGDREGRVAGAVHGVQLDQPGQAALARPAGGGVAAHPPGTRPAAAAQRPAAVPHARPAGCRGAATSCAPRRPRRVVRPCRGPHRGRAGPAASVPCGTSCPVGVAAGGRSCPGSRNRPRGSGSTRPSATRLSRQRSRWASSVSQRGGQRRGGHGAVRGPQHREQRARGTCRSVPCQACPRRGGPVVGRPPGRAATRTGPRRGHSPQRGERAVQTRAPSSITATFQVAAVAAVVRQQPRRPAAVSAAGQARAPGARGRSTARACTRRTLVSTTRGAAAEGEAGDRGGGVGADARAGPAALEGRRAPGRRAAATIAAAAACRRSARRG